jgi:hypothetical protein
VPIRRFRPINWAAASEQPGRWRSRDREGEGKETICRSPRDRSRRGERTGRGRRAISERSVSATHDTTTDRDQPKSRPDGPVLNDAMLLGCIKSGASQIRGPCSIDHMEHVHRRACLRACLHMNRCTCSPDQSFFFLLPFQRVRVCRRTVQANLGKTNSSVNSVSGYPPRGPM